MSRYDPSTSSRLWILTSLTSMTSPSLAEIQAGTDVSAFLTKDGLARPRQGNEVPISNAMQRENLTIAGSVNTGPVSTTLFQDDATDTAWDALVEGSEYYLVYCDRGSGTDGDIAVGDTVEVFHGECLDKSVADLAENQAKRFTTRFGTSTKPEQEATVAT